jgi:outer membrane protein assembly factor BamA
VGVQSSAFACLTVFALLLPSTASQQPAPEGKILAIQVTGSQKYAEAQIALASGLHVGDLVTRDDIQAAADRLTQLGPFSSARYRFTSLGNGIHIELQMVDAATVPVSFDNFPWFTDAELTDALKQAVILFDGTAPEQGTILDAMTEALQKLLATRGVRAAVERTLLAQPAGEGMMQQFKVVGASLTINAVQFGDALAAESKRIHDRLSDLVGKPYSRFAVEVFANEQVRPLYLERGHLRVRIGKPVARFTGNPNRPLPKSVLVIMPVEPGPVYRWGGATWSGNLIFGPAALDEYLGLKKDETANGMRIAGGWQRVQDEYGRRGYLDLKLESKPIYDDPSRRVSYQVNITEGAQYRMGEMVITGLSLAAEHKLLEAWHMPRGQVFDRIYFDEFFATGIKRAFADFVVHFDEVGHWLRTNPTTRTVDVLLDFK